MKSNRNAVSLLRPDSPRGVTACRRCDVIAAAMAWAMALSAAIIVFFPSSGFSRWVSTRFLVAQVIAFARPVGIVASSFLVLALMMSAWMRRWRSIRAPLAILLSASVMSVIFPYASPFAMGDTSHPVNGRTITIVTYNSQGTFSVEDLRELAKSVDPDLIVLPEAGNSISLKEIEEAGFVDFEDGRGFSHGYSGAIAPTRVLVHSRLGHAQLVEPLAPTSFGTVSVKVSNVTVSGIHAAPPLPGLMSSWRQDLDSTISKASSLGVAQILVGDFNATLRHGDLAAMNLQDAALATKNVQGTWPAGKTPLFQIPIDHILVSRDIRCLSTRSLRIGRGDHLALVAQVRLPS